MTHRNTAKFLSRRISLSMPTILIRRARARRQQSLLPSTSNSAPYKLKTELGRRSRGYSSGKRLQVAGGTLARLQRHGRSMQVVTPRDLDRSIDSHRRSHFSRRLRSDPNSLNAAGFSDWATVPKRRSRDFFCAAPDDPGNGLHRCERPTPARNHSRALDCLAKLWWRCKSTTLRLPISWCTIMLPQIPIEAYRWPDCVAFFLSPHPSPPLFGASSRANIAAQILLAATIGPDWQPPAKHSQIPIWPEGRARCAAKCARGRRHDNGEISTHAGKPLMRLGNVSVPQTITVFSPSDDKDTPVRPWFVFPGGGYQDSRDPDLGRHGGLPTG